MNKIKRKTELRQIIRESLGNTGSLRKLAVFNDGTWSIFNTGTVPVEAEALPYWGSLMPEWDCAGELTINQEITKFFRDIEYKLKKGF